MIVRCTQRPLSTTTLCFRGLSQRSKRGALVLTALLILALSGCSSDAEADPAVQAPDTQQTVEDDMTSTGTAGQDATSRADVNAGAQVVDAVTEVDAPAEDVQAGTPDAGGPSDSVSSFDAAPPFDAQMTADAAAPLDVDGGPESEVPSDATQPSDVEVAVDGEVALDGDSEEGAPEGCTDHAAWPTRVLFIGNSYIGSNGGLDSALASFAAGQPCSPGFAMAHAKYSPGGKKLHQHYAEATTEGSTLHGLLNDPLGWDIVVLQDQSQVPGFPKEWSTDKAQSLEQMDDWALLIEGVGARVVFFMTWGRRDGDPANSIYATYSAMQDLLAQGYQEYADLAQAAAAKPVGVAPVGLGWRAVHDDALAVTVGQVETTARFTSLYSGDGSHPSVRGTYLAAAVFFEFLTGTPAALGTWHPDAIKAEDKAWLDEAASAAIASP
ncbi:MAG: hypothetical protein ACPGU1_13185 [Myxococcota bacterium]